MSVDPGFRTERVLSFQLDLPDAAYAPQRRAAFYQDMLDRISRQPGVVSAGAISRLPIRMTSSFRSRFRPEGSALAGQAEPSIAVRIASPGFFETMGVGLVRGRVMTSQDRAGRLPIVVINESAAKWMFPGEDPLGRRLVDFSYDPIKQAAAAFLPLLELSATREVEAWPATCSQKRTSRSLRCHKAQCRLSFTRPVTHSRLHMRFGARSQRLDANLPVTDFLTIEQVVTDLARPPASVDRVAEPVLGRGIGALGRRDPRPRQLCRVPAKMRDWRAHRTRGDAAHRRRNHHPSRVDARRHRSGDRHCWCGRSQPGAGSGAVRREPH